MELRQLRSLIAVIDHGGFRAAASAEHVAQPAITRHLQTLERELGITLFERSGRGVKPTPTAQQLYEAVKSHVVAIDDAGAAVATSSITTLRVGYIAPAVVSFVPRLVEIARSHNPGIQIELRTLTNPELFDEMKAGAIDIGFALTTDVPVRGITATPLKDVHYVLAVRIGGSLAAVNPLPLSALEGRTVVTPATREPTHQQMVDYLRAHADDVSVQDAFSLDAVLGLVGAGVGVAFIPAELITTPPPGIAFVDTEPALPTATLSVVRSARTNRALRPLIDDFIASLAAPPASPPQATAADR